MVAQDIPQRWTLWMTPIVEESIKEHPDEIAYLVLPEGKTPETTKAWYLLDYPVVYWSTEGRWEVFFYPTCSDFTEGEKKQMIDLVKSVRM